MPLVAYDSSGDDSDDGSDETADQTPRSATNSTAKSSATTAPEESSEPKSSTALFSRLPAPKTAAIGAQPLQSSSLSDIVIDKSSSGPIRISVPSLKTYYADDSDDEEERKAKRFKGSATGTGLKALLPKPKHQKVTTASLLPQSLIRRNASTSSAAKSAPKAEEGVNYFFDNTSDEPNAAEFGPKPPPTLPPQPPMTATAQPSDPYPLPSSSGTTANARSLDDMSYKRMIASKFGEEAPEDINIVEVDVSQHLRDSKDWLKTITEEKEETTYNGVEPSSTAKRKHQITYLALQAKQREVELKNEWARNRQTKTQSRAKYGF